MATVEHINPEGLHRNPAFTQLVTVEGAHRTVYIGGQNAVSAEGEIVGKGDIRVQARQVFHNLQKALEAGGASIKDVVKWNVYAVNGQPMQPAIEVFQEVWGRRPNPPTICVLIVAGLANPDFLLEIDAVAVIPM